MNFYSEHWVCHWCSNSLCTVLTQVTFFNRWNSAAEVGLLGRRCLTLHLFGVLCLSPFPEKIGLGTKYSSFSVFLFCTFDKLQFNFLQLKRQWGNYLGYFRTVGSKYSDLKQEGNKTDPLGPYGASAWMHVPPDRDSTIWGSLNNFQVCFTGHWHQVGWVEWIKNAQRNAYFGVEGFLRAKWALASYLSEYLQTRYIKQGGLARAGVCGCLLAMLCIWGNCRLYWSWYILAASTC